MKEIKAIIQPQRLARLRTAFRPMRGFPGMSVTRVEGCSQHGDMEVRSGIQDELTDYSPKVRIEIVAPDEKVEEIVRTIHEQAHTGRAGDGILWITDVVDFRHLREGEGVGEP